MENVYDSSPESNFINYYVQSKQRVDIEVNFTERKLTGCTKLTFIKKPEDLSKLISDNEMEDLKLKLSAENMQINSIVIYPGDNMVDDTTQPLLSFTYLNPIFIDKYLERLYENIEDADSIKNANRIDFEQRHEGNLEISIPVETIQHLSKVKILIKYEIVETFIGVIFHKFFDEKNDIEHDICYTPNFYLNTCHWVPCIYDLRLQIQWRKYIIAPQEYCAYSSLSLFNVYQDNISNKRAYCYKTKEPLSAKNLGFVIINEKIFHRIEDPSNKNIFYVINENKKERLEKSLIQNGLMNAVYNYYEEFFESDLNITSNFNSNTFIIFVPYLTINSNSGFYNRIFAVKEENYFNMIKFPNLYILPEKLIYNDTIPDVMEFQLKNISKLFVNNYIGGLITESTFSDFWLICGIENWLSDNFLLKCYGNNYMKNRLYEYMKTFKQYVKNGKEKRPLYTNNYSHPMELQVDPILFLKSTIVVHLLESQVEKDFIKKALKNIINERYKNGYNISTESFIKIFKKNCGINLKNFMQLWVFKTGMLDLSINYSYNKRTNSIDLEIFQKPVAQKYYENNPHFKLKEINYDLLDKLDKRIGIVDFKIRPLRYFDLNINLQIFQTNGIEIMREAHSVKLELERESLFQNFPLITKIRKAPIKKREQEFIQELVSNTSISKIYSNEEIEKILTHNSIMWVEADSELTHIRNINIPQQHLIYEYIRLFKEGDVIGQYQSIKNIFTAAQPENFQNSLIILETFIRSHAYFKIRLYALKIYIKIIHKIKMEEGYMFLLDYLEDSWIEILKNKSSLNRDSYFVLVKIIKFLGNYREDYFNEFFVIGRVNNSSIQNKIIDKFIAILISNELNMINGFNDVYIMREIFLGCAKLNLQEKTYFLLNKILKCLRIEKLKRSFNEIIIISSLQAFLIVLIKNDFFNNNRLHSHYDSNNVKIVVSEIISEVNHFVNEDCENYELKIFLFYFQIYLIFHKCRNFVEFVESLNTIFFTFEYGIDSNLYDKNFEINSESLNKDFIEEEKENFFAKVFALEYLIEQMNLTFESIREKIEMLTFTKKLMFHRISYYRIDIRSSCEKIFSKILSVPIVSKESVGLTEATPVSNILQNLNKNYLNLSGKKYADEDWLYAFAQADRRDNEMYNSEAKILQSELSSETQSRIGTKHVSLIRKYQAKYPTDSYALLHWNIDIDNKSWSEASAIITDRIVHHPLAYPFCQPLDQESLGDLYDQYHKIIKNPIDLMTVKNRLGAGIYKSHLDFNRDILLVFSNCKEFNLKGSVLYYNAVQLEEFYKILCESMKKMETNLNHEFIVKVHDNEDVTMSMADK